MGTEPHDQHGRNVHDKHHGRHHQHHRAVDKKTCFRQRLVGDVEPGILKFLGIKCADNKHALQVFAADEVHFVHQRLHDPHSWHHNVEEDDDENHHRQHRSDDRPG